MTDTAALEADLMARVAAAPDEAALEALRVATLGKSGSVSGLLATLGKMQPEERKAAGAAFKRAARPRSGRHRREEGAALRRRAGGESLRPRPST